MRALGAPARVIVAMSLVGIADMASATVDPGVATAHGVLGAAAGQL
jgi:hypothetical protein